MEEKVILEAASVDPLEAPQEMEMSQPALEDMLPGDDIGLTKDEIAALAEPVAKGQYTAKFSSLKKNIFKDEATGEERFLGFVHSVVKSGGKKIIPTFMLISDDPTVNNRPISAHVSTAMRLFAQIDKQLDLLTGTRIDPAKVEAAKDKVVTLTVGYEPETIDKQTGKTYAAKNTIVAVLPYKG
jgi:hypothetical protein